MQRSAAADRGQEVRRRTAARGLPGDSEVRNLLPEKRLHCHEGLTRLGVPFSTGICYTEIVERQDTSNITEYVVHVRLESR